MSIYKIEVIKMGAWIGYLYKRHKWLWWKWELVENCIHNTQPYSPKIEEWQKLYNVPDKRVWFDGTKNKTITYKPLNNDQ